MSDQREEEKIFTVRETVSGKLVLKVLDFSVLPASGVWRDATNADLPEFFRRINTWGVK